MITGKTESGFEFCIEEEFRDDYEILELLVDVDKGEVGSIIQVINKLLGEEQKNALKEHIRNEKGRVPVMKMMEEVKSILGSCNNGKNS